MDPVDRLDRWGGRAVARSSAALLAVGVALVGVPMLIGTVVAGEWVGAAIAGVVTVGGAALVRHLWRGEHRLSEMD